MRVILDWKVVFMLVMVVLHLATLKVLLTPVMDQLFVPLWLEPEPMAMEGLLVTLSIHVMVYLAVAIWPVLLQGKLERLQGILEI